MGYPYYIAQFRLYMHFPEINILKLCQGFLSKIKFAGPSYSSSHSEKIFLFPRKSAQNGTTQSG